MFLPQEGKVVNLLPPKDISAAAHSAAYINMKNYGHVDLVITMGATGAIGSSVAVTLTQAANVSGSSSAALPMNAYWTNGAAVASASIDNSVFARAAVGSSAATFKLTPSTNNITYVIPVNAQQLSAGLDCVGIGVGITGAGTLCGVAAILSKARYQGANPPSALS